ncbi:MAG: aspartate dehydrogenase [Thermoprotei archaeon]
MKRIGIIGCGAIGSVIADAVDNGVINAELAGLYDIIVSKCRELAGKLVNSKPRVCDSIDCLLELKPDIVVEAASQEAVREYVPKILDHGIEVVVLSVGALLDENLLKTIEEKCREKKVNVYVPSGAIAGIDAIRALSSIGIKRVVLITRKNPRSISRDSLEKLGFSGEIKEPTVIYEGPAEEAVKKLPANINVAATLKLASKAPVIVRFIADPSVGRNIHEIIVESSASKLHFIVENTPHPQNPKTSYLAALSAVELLRRLTSKGIIIGS